MSESIYNIIPKEYVPPPKEPRYKSKYPPNIPPTGSTFGNHTTSKPNHVLSYLSSRLPIYQDNSTEDSKHILSLEAPKLLVIWKMIENHLLMNF